METFRFAVYVDGDRSGLPVALFATGLDAYRWATAKYPDRHRIARAAWQLTRPVADGEARPILCAPDDDSIDYGDGDDL